MAATKKIKLQPRVVIIISIIIGIVMIASAYFELNESKKELFQILSESSSSLIETISMSSINTLNSGYEIEDLITERLLNNARMIKMLDSMKVLSHKKLKEICEENDIYRINIFDKKGERILSSWEALPGHIHDSTVTNRYSMLNPILSGETDQLIIGLKGAEHNGEKRYAVAVARSGNNGAIVVNLDAKDLLEFRKKIGIGKIIQDIGDNSGIEYVVLQDSLGILAASSSVKSIEPIEGDKFLSDAMKTDSIFKRIYKYDGREVYEVVKRLVADKDVIGLYRIGVPLDEVNSLEARMYRRIIIITLLLGAISIIVLSIIFTSQTLRTVSDEFSRFKTFTGTVLENMGEAVIVLDAGLNVTLFNKAAETLFGVLSVSVINSNINTLPGGRLNFISEAVKNYHSGQGELQKSLEINGTIKHLSINISENISEQSSTENYTVVIKDFTERKNLEEQARRNEKLSAMGELASGVAHEIRNPINSIGMIAQRLEKEFSPAEDTEEYRTITGVLKSEVTRINKIITQFLNYARPMDLQISEIDAGSFFAGIYQLFLDQAKIKNIKFSVTPEKELRFKADPELLKQALMNILRNAFDAVSENGLVNVSCTGTGNKILIDVSDDGPGIPDDSVKKIFDLYYTTKNEGNGLGLSIAQKIIDQHRGIISVDSGSDRGTKFTIKIPKV